MSNTNVKTSRFRRRVNEPSGTLPYLQRLHLSHVFLTFIYSDKTPLNLYLQ